MLLNEGPETWGLGNRSPGFEERGTTGLKPYIAGCYWWVASVASPS